MPLRLVVGALLLAFVMPAFGKRTPLALCRQSCGTTIQQCVAGGKPRGRCKRQVLRRCRRTGVTVCTPPGTYHVAPTGSDLPECGPANAPCRTIQFVVGDLVPAGGTATVKVAAGTYSDLSDCVVGTVPNQAVVCILNRQITLRGGYTPPDWDTQGDPSATVIDPHRAGRAFRVVRTRENGTPASLDMAGFTIQNGLAQGASSGGIEATWVGGGGMLVESSALTLRDVVFRNNEARGGTTNGQAGGRASAGALTMYSLWPSVAAPATLERVTFDGNHAYGGGGDDTGGYALGGAVFTYGVAVTGDDLVFTGNSATAGGTSGSGTSGGDKGDALGGAFGVGQDGVADLHHVRASGNVATGGSAPNGEAGSAFGGAFFAEAAELRITDSVVAQNLARGGNGRNATNASGIAQGGGVYATMSPLTIDRTSVVANEAHAGDGAVNGGVPEGGGVAVTLAARDGVVKPFAITNTVIADNAVTMGAGTPPAGGGGGLFLHAATGTVEHTTIARNRLSPPLLGVGVCLFYVSGWETAVTFRNSIIAEHAPAGGAPSCYTALFVIQNTSADVSGMLFAGNVHDTNVEPGGGCGIPAGSIGMSGIVGGATAGFVSPGDPDEDYHLTPASPAVDQAIGSTLTVDLDGHPRPIGAAADLGAYELMP